ncbi:MAG: glucose 1-dehydrogenase [Kiloniellales bacterium]|nr:glucose 1-dehydrogenase [Kiloniellales bacterium]
MRLEGKVAVVTGAASGFGEGIARCFAEEGAALILADINGATANRLAAEFGGRAVAVEADVSKREDVRRMLQASETFGGLDILVNNAGISHINKPFSEVTDDEFERIYAVNVKSVYLGIQEALPFFEARGSGVVINTSSTAALRPRPGLSVYNSSKGAVNVLTKSLAVELAEKSIRVNAVCPVMGETGLLETFMGLPDTTENRRKFLASIPLGRLSRPEDIAKAALFLASDDAAFLTGLTMEVDGGRCV